MPAKPKRAPTNVALDHAVGTYLWNQIRAKHTSRQAAVEEWLEFESRNYPPELPWYTASPRLKGHG